MSWPIIVNARKGYQVAWNLEQLLSAVEPLLSHCEQHDYTTVVKDSTKMSERFLQGLIRGEYSPSSEENQHFHPGWNRPPGTVATFRDWDMPKPRNETSD
ncbi:hypothetical protein [Nocardia sp. NPDC046763]|uniref:hypothetical protein n=1 Tax=Nocardia sp. NPDC046763 TaxID=3155256 RepID=UPI0033D33E92